MVWQCLCNGKTSLWQLNLFHSFGLLNWEQFLSMLSLMLPPADSFQCILFLPASKKICFIYIFFLHNLWLLHVCVCIFIYLKNFLLNVWFTLCTIVLTLQLFFLQANVSQEVNTTRISFSWGFSKQLNSRWFYISTSTAYSCKFWTIPVMDDNRKFFDNFYYYEFDYL